MWDSTKLDDKILVTIDKSLIPGEEKVLGKFHYPDAKIIEKAKYVLVDYHYSSNVELVLEIDEEKYAYYGASNIPYGEFVNINAPIPANTEVILRAKNYDSGTRRIMVQFFMKKDYRKPETKWK